MNFNEKMIKKITGYHTTCIVTKGDVPVIQYEKLNAVPWLKNGFSTRIGGVSRGIYESMNLSFTVGDEEKNVVENFKRFGEAFHTPVENMVYSHQTHTTHVMRVDSSHKGMGILRERDFHDIDGLVTNEPGVCLVTSYADCVPLYFVDTENKAIGLSHSGWRGTTGNICKNTLAVMAREFGTRAENVTACIGPSICQNCYEVSEDVAKQFMDNYDKPQWDILKAEENGKYLLDLHRANYYNMVNCGIPKENISMPDLCTCCNAEWLHSHRATKGKRGGLCAFLKIREHF